MAARGVTESEGCVLFGWGFGPVSVCVGVLWDCFRGWDWLSLSAAGLVMKLLLLVAYFLRLLLFVFFLSTYLDWQMAMAMGG